MVQDYEVTRLLWDSRIPVMFRLDKSEYLGASVKPYIVMVHRMSYFPVVMPLVVRHFQRFIENFDGGSLWLEYNSKPLKWHHPVGVLYDIFKPEPGALVLWIITVKTKNRPKEIMHINSTDIESSFIQSIKEADQLKHKSSIINAMSIEMHKQLWNSLVQNKYDDYWAVNKELTEETEDRPYLHVPIRIHKTDGSFRQPLITPYDESSEKRQIGDALEAVGLKRESSILCHGVKIPTTTSLVWLLKNYTYLDNFIHIVVLDA